jgi:hypothetical protein
MPLVHHVHYMGKRVDGMDIYIEFGLLPYRTATLFY